MHPAIRFILRGLVTLYLLLGLAFLLAGCGGGGTFEEEPTATSTPPVEAASARTKPTVPTPRARCQQQPKACV
jgi:predicted small lipoprotein YifL